MEENQETERKKTNKILKEVDEKICQILEDGIQIDNLDALGKLVDIHKDIKNEEYWKKKGEVIDMRYRDYRDDYGNYGRRSRDSRGRYMTGGRGMYRGEEMIEDMHENYRDYTDGREEYMRGNYGAQSATMKSLDYMLQSVVEFLEMLKKDASSQEEMELIQKYTREISEM